ncbi:MAG TPA: sulfite exporter TauE/SafE family protein [Burkholderiales bacterium]|nr:sulfite exporter TauE/SafE family protein [Burkholderiales bacterium]
MAPALPAAMALLGAASGMHCVGMCGGIVTAFSAQRIAFGSASKEWPRQLLFNAGRITSYSAMGAAAGALGSGLLASEILAAQTVLLVAANIVLILVGLQLAGRGAALARLESLGAPLWRRLQPAAARLLGAHALPQVYAAGVLWGWLPCGLVYGALALAAAGSSSAPEGAGAMLAYGAGTLPWLLAAGVAAAKLRTWFARRAVRAAAGTAVLAFGLYGVASAAGVAEAIRRGILCL